MTREQGIRLVERLNREAGIPSWKEILHPKPYVPMEERMLSTTSPFCTALVACGLLSQKQMEHAALRYRLGESRFNWTVFWQIDLRGIAIEGRAIYYVDNGEPDPDCTPQWVSNVLFLQCNLPRTFPITTCLFGLHLLLETTDSKEIIIAVVREERTAVVMSELMPKYLWIAVGDDAFLRPDLFFPLKGHRLIVFPERPVGSPAFAKWQQVCQMAGQQMGQYITVSEAPLL